MTDNKSQLHTLLLMLMGIVILLMIAITGLFLKMTQLQQVVIAAIAPAKAQTGDSGSTHSLGLEIGGKAPEFALADLAGDIVALNDFADQAVVLVFSSTHCPACRALYPHLQTFRKLHATSRVIMIPFGADQENQEIAAEYAFDFPVLQWESAIAQAYKVPGTPFLYWIDSRGRITGRGFVNTLEDIARLMGVNQE